MTPEAVPSAPSRPQQASADRQHDDQLFDRQLKTKHRAVWSLGDYPAVAARVVAGLGPILVEAAGIRSGQTVLDVACGSGNATIPAAQTGADVVALDLTPALLEAGRAAADRTLRIRWREGDAERLQCNADDYDVVISSVGVMFAPHHQSAADEIVRVCKPGGTIALIAWTPTGFIGQMFTVMKQFVPPPPPGAQPAPLWGTETHVRALFGDRVDLSFSTAELPVTCFGSDGDFRRFFAANYGPTIAAYAGLVDDPNRGAQLDAALDDLARRHDRGRGAMAWEYLLVRGVVR